MNFSGNWFDITFIAIILILALLAFLRGFIKDFAAFLNWLVAISLTYLLSPHIVKLFEKSKYSEIIIKSAVSSILFIVLLIVISMITSRICKSLEDKIPGGVDQSLGFAFGFAKGYFLCALFFGIIVALYSSGLINAKEPVKTKAGKRIGPDWLIKAQSYKILEVGADILKPLTDIIVKSVEKTGLANENSAKDEILNKLDEMEKSAPKQEEDDFSDEEVTSGKGYNFKEIKKMNRLIETLDSK